MNLVKLRMTSRRTGKVGWVRADGSIGDHESEAGRFRPDDALARADEIADTYVRAIGACRWNFDLIP